MDVQNDTVCNVTVRHAEIAALTRGVTSIICFLLCLLALVFEVVYICHQKRTNTLQRLYLYLTVSTVFYTGILSLHIEHGFRYEGQDGFCTAIAVLDQFTGSIQLILTLGITLILFYKVIACFEFFAKVKTRFKPHGGLKRQQIGYILEVVLCATSIILPWFVIWIPFLSTTGSTYGAGTSPWCWIESKDPTTCEQLERGMLEQILLWYVPFGLVAIISVCCIVSILIFFCYLRSYKSILKAQTQALIRDMILLLVFLVFFCTVWLIETIIRIIINAAAFPDKDIFALWMVYAIITPVGGISVPLGFFFYFSCSKVSKLVSSNRSDITVLEYSEIQTGRRGNNLFHSPSRITPMSHTSDRDSKFFMTDDDRAMLGSTCPSMHRANYHSTTATVDI